MHHIHSSTRRAASAVLILILLAVALSACGSSSSKSASATSAAKLSANAGPQALSARFTALRECLAKNGIALPKRPAGQGPRGGFLGGILGGGGAAGLHLPSGVSRAQYEAALKKCGAGPPLRGGTRGFGRLRAPAFQAALKKFAACMRANGVNVPEPNTSGSGPIFGTSGLDTKSPQFKAATSKCASQLRVGFKPRAGTAPGTPGGGAQPTG